MVVQRIPGHICGDRMVLLFLLKRRAGVRNTAMDGSDQVIRETVKRCIDGLIEESHIEESQVQGIFARGC